MRTLIALVLACVAVACGPVHVDKPRRFAVAITNVDAYDYSVDVRAWGPGASFTEVKDVLVPARGERVVVFGEAIPDLVELAPRGGQSVSWDRSEFGSWWLLHVNVPTWSTWCDVPIDRSIPYARGLRGL